MVSPANVKVFVISSAALYLKFLACVMIQGGKTFRAGGRPPEDGKLSLAKGQPKQTYGLEFDPKDERVIKARLIEQRWRRIVANDLETIPLGLFVFAGGVLANANETTFAGSMAAFTLARYIHSYVYAKGMQPHRAFAWFASHISIFVGMGAAIAGASRL
jgi:glutathione S-transferase